MKPQPLVSIVIPVKNGAEFLNETLNSVLDQSYKNIEIVVIDDGSTDRTIELLSEIRATDNRVKFMENQDSPHGAPACRNIGYRMASGKYIIFLDADDLLKQECVENRVRIFEQKPYNDFIVFQCELFNQTPGDMGIYWNYFSAENDLDRFIRVDTPWQTSGPIWKKKSIEIINGWDEDAISWQDWEFHIRALTAGFSYLKVPEVDFYYRKNVVDSISKRDISEERYLYFGKLMKKMYLILDDSNQLTSKRKRYLMGKLTHIAIISFSYFNNWNLARAVLLNAFQLGEMSKFGMNETLLISFFLAHFDNRVVNKIAWLRLRDYYFFVTSAKGFHNTKILSQ